MRIVLLADTHLNEVPVPDGDILVHAGDLTLSGSLPELWKAAAWLKSLPHPHKVAVAGNHDWAFQRTPNFARRIMEEAGIIYLQDEEAEVAGLKFWGSPWQPEFCGWAFNLPRGAALAEKWSLIPAGLDVLVTHGPPLGLGDSTEEGPQGDIDLLARIKAAEPLLHVYGHIHPGHGVYQAGLTLCINAAVCDDYNRPAHRPVVVDWQGGPWRFWEE